MPSTSSISELRGFLGSFPAADLNEHHDPWLNALAKVAEVESTVTRKLWWDPRDRYNRNSYNAGRGRYLIAPNAILTWPENEGLHRQIAAQNDLDERQTFGGYIDPDGSLGTPYHLHTCEYPEVSPNWPQNHNQLLFLDPNQIDLPGMVQQAHTNLRNRGKWSAINRPMGNKWEPWVPGVPGKGIVTYDAKGNPQWTTWQTQTGGNDAGAVIMGSPHHGEYLNAQGIDWIRTPEGIGPGQFSDKVFISPEGYYAPNTAKPTENITGFVGRVPGMKYDPQEKRIWKSSHLNHLPSFVSDAGWGKPYKRGISGPQKAIPAPAFKPGDTVLHAKDDQAIGKVLPSPEMWQDALGEWHVYVNWETTVPRRYVFKHNVDQENNVSGQYQRSNYSPGSMWAEAKDLIPSITPQSPGDLTHPDPWMDNEPGSLTFPQEWTSGTLVVADNYTQDTRNWPDPTEPRPAGKPEEKGCTCHLNQKLECPVHGLHAIDPDYDRTWSIPQAQPVGFPQDTPRNWTQAKIVPTSVNQMPKVSDTDTSGHQLWFTPRTKRDPNHHHWGLEYGHDDPLAWGRAWRHGQSTKGDSMKPMHDPGTYLYPKDNGFSSFGQYEKPSRIGLPTDTTRVGAIPRIQDYDLGEYQIGGPGKGAIYEGKPYIWRTDIHGMPNHLTQLERIIPNLDPHKVHDFIVINPEGHFMPEACEPTPEIGKFHAVNPDLQFRRPDRWFGSVHKLAVVVGHSVSESTHSDGNLSQVIPSFVSLGSFQEVGPVEQNVHRSNHSDDGLIVDFSSGIFHDSSISGNYEEARRSAAQIIQAAKRTSRSR